MKKFINSSLIESLSSSMKGYVRSVPTGETYSYNITLYYNKNKNYTMFAGEVSKDKPIATLTCEKRGTYERAEVQVWHGDEHVSYDNVRISRYLMPGEKIDFDFSDVVNDMAFIEYLKYASETVKSWPEWKQKVLG